MTIITQKKTSTMLHAAHKTSKTKSNNTKNSKTNIPLNNVQPNSVQRNNVPPQLIVRTTDNSSSTQANNATEAHNGSQKIITSLTALLDYLAFPVHIQQQLNSQMASEFALRVPMAYASKIKKNDLNDPLLKQILPTHAEQSTHPDYVLDPLAETQANVCEGLIHKYQSRVLLTATSACAIHCRYCFRQHYDYQGNQLTAQNWQHIANYISSQPAVNEVILSGGDPLSLSNRRLFELLDKIEALPQIRTIRLHSRHAVAIVARLDDTLTQRLVDSRCHIVLVTHANHPNEVGTAETTRFQEIRQTSITLLNQSVLLKGVNDHADTLAALSYALFDAGIMPYYLHLLDKVAGAAHFNVPQQTATQIYKKLLATLPGYLVPKLVHEQANQPNKTLVSFR